MKRDAAALAAGISDLRVRGQERDRPSRHGAILGEVLAALADAGRKEAGAEHLGMCVTCAFRPGCMTNQMASTGMTALNCVLGVDPDDFACHHNLASDGQPTKLCVGYLAAKLAPWEFTNAAIAKLHKCLEAIGESDEVRAAFDAWIAEVDPHDLMDDYQRGQAYLRRDAEGAQGRSRASAEVRQTPQAAADDRITQGILS